MKFKLFARCDDAPFLDNSGLDQQAQVIFDETPQVRRERVLKLRHQVRSGTYEIPFPQLVGILASLFLKRP